MVQHNAAIAAAQTEAAAAKEQATRAQQANTVMGAQLAAVQKELEVSCCTLAVTTRQFAGVC